MVREIMDLTTEQPTREKKKKIRRKVRKIDSSGQIGLFRPSVDEDTEHRRSCERGCERLPEFIDPNPEGILIGNERLSEFLSRMGEVEGFTIRELLEGIDWKDFEKKSRSGGRRPYSPRAMVGLILFGILEGRSSLRQLEKLGRTDLRAMWITGGISPDHTVLGRFINRHEDLLTDQFFRDLTRQVIKRTVSSTEQGALDGTVVQAAASRYKMIKAEAAAEAAQESRRRAEEKPDDAKLRRQAEQAEAVAAVAQHRIAARKAYRKKNPENVRVSATEPEAVNQPLKNQVKAAAYKPSIIVNTDRIILGQGVDPSSEQDLVAELLKQAQQISGAPLEEVMADSNYFTSSVIEQVLTAGVTSFLSPEGQSLSEGSWERRSDKIPKTQFRYDAEKDCYHCPGGQQLTLIGRGTERGKPFWTYGKAPCQSCSLRSQCTTSRDGRHVRRYSDDQIKDQIRERMRQPEARRTYSKRRSMVEPVFSSLKGQQGLTRFRRRGLRKVSLEFALHAAAHNVGRLLVIALRPKPGDGPSPAPHSSIFSTIWVFLLRESPRPYEQSGNELNFDSYSFSAAA